MKQEWLEWRRQGIGASDAPIIMGVSPFKTINQLWKEKVMGWQQEDNSFMARGRALEDEALGKFMMETGYFLTSQVQKIHENYDWMRATLDGWDENEKILVEIKTCKFPHQEIPKHYYPQVQHQMAVTGIDHMFYFSYDGKNGKILEVKRDEEYCEKMIKKEFKFWTNVKKGMLDLTNDEDFNFHMEKIKEIKKKKKELAEEENFHLSQLILFSDGCAANGKEGILVQVERKGTIQYENIPELQGIDFEVYRKPPSKYWSVK